MAATEGHGMHADTACCAPPADCRPLGGACGDSARGDSARGDRGCLRQLSLAVYSFRLRLRLGLGGLIFN